MLLASLDAVHVFCRDFAPAEAFDRDTLQLPQLLAIPDTAIIDGGPLG